MTVLPHRLARHAGAFSRRSSASGNCLAVRGGNSKSEARTPKQIQTPNGGMFENCPSKVVLDIPALVLGICFGFRASDFGFQLPGLGRGVQMSPSASHLALWPALSHVISAAAADTNTDLEKIPPLRPPLPEIPPTFWEQHGWQVVAGGVLVVALCGLGLWLLLRRKLAAAIPPAVQARQALEPLRQQPEDGVVLSHVSQVLRHYIAAAFELPSGELTTAEFCRALVGDQRVGPALSVPITNFLRQCDERKFAPSPPGPALGAVGQAFQFIDQAEARLVQLRQAQPKAP